MAWKYNVGAYDEGTAAGGFDLSSAQGALGRPPGGLWHTGNSPACLAADGVDSTPVITEIYIAAVFIPFTITATGIAVMNGSVVATDKYRVILYNSAGVAIRSSALAGFQPATVDAYELVAFALNGANVAATTITLPTGTYFVGTIYNGTTNRFNAHGVGAHPGGKITGATFGTAGNTTEIAITPPTAFTAASKPPIAAIY